MTRKFLQFLIVGAAVCGALVMKAPTPAFAVDGTPCAWKTAAVYGGDYKHVGWTCVKGRWYPANLFYATQVRNLNARTVAVTFDVYSISGESGQNRKFLRRETKYLQANQRWSNSDYFLLFQVLSVNVIS